MKKVLLIGIAMVAAGLAGCADPAMIQSVPKDTAATGQSTDSQKVASTAETMVADLEANLKGVPSAKSTQSKLQVSKTANRLKLTSAQTQVILATTKMALDTAGLTNSNDLTSLIPVLVQGAALGIGAIQSTDTTNISNLLAAVANSVLNSIVNVSSGSVPTSMLQSLTEALFASLSQSGVNSSNIQTVSNSVINSILSRLNESNVSTSGFETLLQNLATGVVSGLGQLNLPTTLLSAVLNSIGSGSLLGITNLVSNVIGVVTGTNGSTWLTNLLNAFTNGITSGLNALNSSGSISGAVGSFASAFLQGMSGQASTSAGSTTSTGTATTSTSSTFSSIVSIVAGVAQIAMLFL